MRELGIPAFRAFPLILAAPSGAGKTTIARKLREHRADVVVSVYATTRPPRPQERHRRDYWFRAEDEFREQVGAGELAEWAEVHGHLYGTPMENIRRAAEQRQILLLDIDVQGARQIRAAVPGAVSVFILPPSGRELAGRLTSRGSEGEEVRRRRLTNACREIAAAQEFDYVIVNDDLERAVGHVDAILRAESARCAHLVGLAEYATRLCVDIESSLI
ncbi:guanylate kinase [soil metagenome]